MGVLDEKLANMVVEGLIAFVRKDGALAAFCEKKVTSLLKHGVSNMFFLTNLLLTTS